MKPVQLRALAADAFHQVLDNGVFRVLAFLCALPVLATFLVGAREDGLVVLFGLKTWSYADLFGAFGVSLVPPDARGLVIETVLQLVLQFLAGTLGVLVAIAATAFFVPRLLEKGAAELYFHKPVSRLVLYLSRYVAGLLFVGLVSLLLVVGMYLGLLLVSHHNDPGILLGSLTLTYCFAPVYAFTMLCGVVTRSTMAALLLSSFFFLFNGCIHKSWIQWQQHEHGPNLRRALEETPAEKGTESDSGRPEEEKEERRTDEAESPTTQRLLGALDAVHLLLPKTTDADFLGQKLRKALDPPPYRDASSFVALRAVPEGMHVVTAAAPDDGTLPAELHALLGESVVALEGEPTRAVLWRRDAERSETRFGERVRVRIETATQAAKTLEKALESRAGDAGLERGSERFGATFGRGGLAATSLAWSEGEGQEARARAAFVFKGTDDGTVFTLWIDSTGALAPEAVASERKRVTSELYLDTVGIGDWYPDQLAFDAPLRFNIFFSIGSTLAFAAALLALGAWRLGRIAF